MSTRLRAKAPSKAARPEPRKFEPSGFLLIDNNLNVVKAPSTTKRPAAVKPGRRQYSRGGLGETVVKGVNLERMLTVVMTTYKRVTKGEPGLGEQALLQAVSTDLAEAAQDGAPPTVVAEGWQALLEKGLADKRQLLASTKFRSVRAAAAVLGVGEPAIRKQIRQGQLFAVTLPRSDEYRIPVWALGLSADDTKALMAAETDPWALYLYLDAPSGALNGMRPFELLLPTESLSPEQKGQRQALLEFRGLADRGSLVNLVLEDLRNDQAPTA